MTVAAVLFELADHHVGEHAEAAFVLAAAALEHDVLEDADLLRGRHQVDGLGERGVGVERHVAVQLVGNIVPRDELVHADVVERVHLLLGHGRDLGHEGDGLLLRLRVDVPQAEEGRGVGHGLRLRHQLVVLPVPAAVADLDHVARVVGLQAGPKLVAHAELVEDRLEGGLAHGDLPVREEVVRVPVLLDAHHLAAEKTVLLDEQGVDATLLQEGGAGAAARSTTDHDDVIGSLWACSSHLNQLLDGFEQAMVLLAIQHHRVEQRTEEVGAWGRTAAT